MYHHTSSTVAHTPNIFQNQSSVDDEDTSLYSPLPIARPEGNDNDGVNVTGTTTKHHTSNNTNEDKTNANKANHIKQGSSMNLNSCQTDRKSIITLRRNQNETDEDYDEDDDEEGDEVGYLENGIKKHAMVSFFFTYTHLYIFLPLMLIVKH